MQALEAALAALFSVVDPIWLGWLAAALILAGLNGRSQRGRK
jgi:hypothetical protein